MNCSGNRWSVRGVACTLFPSLRWQPCRPTVRTWFTRTTTASPFCLSIVAYYAPSYVICTGIEPLLLPYMPVCTYVCMWRVCFSLWFCCVENQVIMATNRADTLDPALLRPGRLDRKIEFPVPDRRQKRMVFTACTAKMNLSEARL